ncbi:MAG: S26 family signal peptidase, partial [Phycisphaerae bacterium]
RPDKPGAEWAAMAPPAELGAMRRGRGHKVALTHVDFRVTLWLDDRPILVSRDRGAGAPAGGLTDYPMDYRLLKERLEQARAQVGGVKVPRPKVKLAAAGGRCRLWHVKLMRDVYYTSPKFQRGPTNGPDGEFAQETGVRQGQLGWGTDGHPITLRKHSRDRRHDLDQFFVLGDNSPSSLDGRLWTSAAATLRLYDADNKPVYQLGTVPRYNLIGKAIFVYWPAGFCVPGLPRLPILPNVGRMRLIR